MYVVHVILPQKCYICGSSSGTVCINVPGHEVYWATSFELRSRAQPVPLLYDIRVRSGIRTEAQGSSARELPVETGQFYKRMIRIFQGWPLRGKSNYA